MSDRGNSRGRRGPGRTGGRGAVAAQSTHSGARAGRRDRGRVARALRPAAAELGPLVLDAPDGPAYPPGTATFPSRDDVVGYLDAYAAHHGSTCGSA